MSFTRWLRNLRSVISPGRVERNRRRSLPRGAAPRYRPRAETLEDRTLLDGHPGLDPFLFTPVSDDTPLALHIHPHLSILVDGQAQVIPEGTGLLPAGDLPIHTHDASGTIHVESPVARNFSLQDFFGVWGQTFSDQEILGHHTDATHQLSMTVNGQVSQAFGTLVLHDLDNIVIRYGDLQSTGVTAAVWTDRPDYAPGTIALIGGRGFAAAEQVDLQVVHGDGRPNTDASHTPWTVVADATGAIHTSWLVDPVDAVGSTLQVKAFGETSHATAQATFTDSPPIPHPFWIIGHNPNDLGKAEDDLKDGANALEPDIQAWPNDSTVGDHVAGLAIAHVPFDPSPTNLVDYLQGLANLADKYPNFALVVFDVKSSAANPDPDDAPAKPYAQQLVDAIQLNLLNRHPDIHVIVSVASFDDDVFFDSLQGYNYNPALAFQIDAENDPLAVTNILRDKFPPPPPVLAPPPGFVAPHPAFISFGDGTANCCGRVFGTNTPPALDQAVWVRTALGTLNAAMYAFAVTGEDAMRMFLNAGVDGLITSDEPALLGDPFNGDLKNLAAIVSQHYGGVYLATRTDDPFSVLGAQNGAITGSRQGYGLEVQTATSTGAGTDANLTFTLHGELGDATAVMDSSWPKKMENGDTNYVFIRSPDLGHLKSITVTEDGSGGKFGNPFGWGSAWDVSWIKVRSFAYIGGGAYPTVGDPNKSLVEYFADFGGQTVHDNTPFTVALRSGIPFLATLTNGDLVLNMGPNAAARVEGNVADGDESFTVHNVSTQADGTETVTVSAFGLGPQTYQGVKQIHGWGVRAATP